MEGWSAALSCPLPVPLYFQHWSWLNEALAISALNPRFAFSSWGSGGEWWCNLQFQLSSTQFQKIGNSWFSFHHSSNFHPQISWLINAFVYRTHAPTTVLCPDWHEHRHQHQDPILSNILVSKSTEMLQDRFHQTSWFLNRLLIQGVMQILKPGR